MHPTTQFFYGPRAGGRLVPSEDPTMEGTWIDLGTLFSFATGADVVPPAGFANQPNIDFDTRTDRDLPTASTCSPTLHFPLALANPDLFRVKMDYALCGCHGYGQI